MEEDFALQPGADPKRISLRFQGVRHSKLNDRGDLVLSTAAAALTMQKPRAYQLVQNKEVDVPVAYDLHDGHASFRLGPYDKRQALIIDPVLVYSTFFGGIVTSMALDSSGLYLSGTTYSSTFPTTAGVVQPTPLSFNDFNFVSKLDPTGQSLIFSTYITGFGGSYLALTVDPSGNTYIAGLAAGVDVLGGGVASNLPIPAGSHPFQSAQKGYQNLAILKLNSTGTAVVAATYFGGSNREWLCGMAVDSAQNIYVSCTTNSNDFPTQSPLQATLGTSSSNAFIAKLNPTLSGLVYSTYLGANSGASTEFLGSPNSLALDSSDNVYIVGVDPWPVSVTPLMALVLCACGGGSTSMQNPNGTSAGTYTLVVTAKSGSTTQTQNLTLTVQ